MALNCAAIPESLIENELFGHEKGAFTGADRRQPGRFELAQGGTLFLDEIGELPVGVQGKVLRVLEERTFERVGGGKTLRADVRLVAATNRDLAAMVEAGEFRADLFFRLNVFPIELPPLRERASDVPLLARHLLGEIARRHRHRAAAGSRKTPPACSPEEPWPGNVRELANVLERAVILTEGPAIRAADLRPMLRPLAGAGGPPDQPARANATGSSRRWSRPKATSTGRPSCWASRYRTLLRKVKEHDLEGVPRYRE